MKKKHLFFLALIIMLGTAVSGCYVNRGYYHSRYYPHHYHHHHEWHNY